MGLFVFYALPVFLECLHAPHRLTGTKQSQPSERETWSPRGSLQSDQELKGSFCISFSDCAAESLRFFSLWAQDVDLAWEGCSPFLSCSTGGVGFDRVGKMQRSKVPVILKQRSIVKGRMGVGLLDMFAVFCLHNSPGAGLLCCSKRLH